MRYRPRRLRKKERLRKLVSEVQLSNSDLIMPVFLVPGTKIKQQISALPGCFHLSPDRVVAYLEEPIAAGLQAVLLFGVPREESKDALGTGSVEDSGVVQQGIRNIKQAYPELVIISDVCLCGYTDHGHCGVYENGRVKNDPTLELLGKMALSQARAGADLVAPSDMMDGRVDHIRKVLDDKGFKNTGIMSYSIKYDSSFYGPFRSAAGSAPGAGGRSSYQMDYRRRREARYEAELDFQEGADILMVKPALAYLDIIREIRDRTELPLAAYSVSGEYALIKNGAAAGICDEVQMMLEVLTAIKRAGADMIITYFASEFLKLNF